MNHTYRNRSRTKMEPLYGLFWGLLWMAPAVALLYGLIFEGDQGSLSGTSWWWGGSVLAFAFCVVWSRLGYEQLFRWCYEIRLSDEGTCQFRSPLGRKRVHVHDILSVYPHRWQINDEDYTVVRYQGGKRFVVQPIDGFPDFLDRLRALNPKVVLHDLPSQGEDAHERGHSPGN